MEKNKVITYTVEIDREKYNTLPVVKALSDPNLKGSAESTAEIILTLILGLPEVRLNNQRSWEQGNYRALVSWAGSADFLGERKLMQQSQGKDESGAEIFVISKIKGIP